MKLTYEQEMYCRQTLTATEIELMVAEQIGITSEELSYYYWL